MIWGGSGEPGGAKFRFLFGVFWDVDGKGMLSSLRTWPFICLPLIRGEMIPIWFWCTNGGVAIQQINMFGKRSATSSPMVCFATKASQNGSFFPHLYQSWPAKIMGFIPLESCYLEIHGFCAEHFLVLLTQKTVLFIDTNKTKNIVWHLDPRG